jgi:hypothetical protein
MTGYPSCKTCACFFRSHSGAREGQCRRKSPVPVLLGVAHAPQLPGIIGMKNGANQPQPVINGFFPPVAEHIWCMEWLPIDATPEEIDEHRGADA